MQICSQIKGLRICIGALAHQVEETSAGAVETWQTLKSRARSLAACLDKEKAAALYTRAFTGKHAALAKAAQKMSTDVLIEEVLGAWVACHKDAVEQLLHGFKDLA